MHRAEDRSHKPGGIGCH